MSFHDRGFNSRDGFDSSSSGSLFFLMTETTMADHDRRGPVQYESAQTSDPDTRGYPVDCTELALPGGPSELTPTVTKVIFVRAWFLPLCYECTETMRIE